MLLNSGIKKEFFNITNYSKEAEAGGIVSARTPDADVPRFLTVRHTGILRPIFAL